MQQKGWRGCRRRRAGFLPGPILDVSEEAMLGASCDSLGGTASVLISKSPLLTEEKPFVTYAPLNALSSLVSTHHSSPLSSWLSGFCLKHAKVAMWFSESWIGDFGFKKNKTLSFVHLIIKWDWAVLLVCQNICGKPVILNSHESIWVKISERSARSWTFQMKIAKISKSNWNIYHTSSATMEKYFIT